MVFSSTTFLFYFFPCFLLLYYALPWKNGVLLAGSLVFYAWGEPRFVPLLMLSALLNYGFGMLIARAHSRRALALGAGIGVNLCLLAYYKYLGFFGAVYNQLAPAGHGLTLAAVVLPLGISFFTFQGISYLIDLYRRDIAVQTSFWRFAMYKAMFPQLIAGPIVRYSQIAADIDHRSIDNARVLRGVQQFVVGLAQKVLIANTVAMPADRIFGVDPANLTGVTAWVGAACYTIQILYDFAGYSNMAIGIGHMLGFTYPANFRRPYAALSITDFWRRWHISLSSWFRDYLYIPLGGNRGTPARTYFNLALVFLLCGLWHGAAWTFVIWGLWHGALLVLERLGLGRVLARAPNVIAQAWTLAMVVIGWVFFRAADVPYALAYLRAMFGLGHADPVFYPWQTDVGTSAGIALVVGIVLAVARVGEGAQAGAGARAAAGESAREDGGAPVLAPLRSPARRTAFALARTLACAVAFMLCVVSLAAGTYNPFIYFRF